MLKAAIGNTASNKMEGNASRRLKVPVVAGSNSDEFGKGPRFIINRAIADSGVLARLSNKTAPRRPNQQH